MKTRQEIVDQLKETIDQVNARISSLEEQAQSLSSGVSKEFEEELQLLRKRRDQASAVLSELKGAGGDAWKELEVA